MADGQALKSQRRQQREPRAQARGFSF